MKNDKQILIIEPERLAGLDLQLQLEKKGYSVLRPIYQMDAEAVISKDKPDLIIADTEINKNIFDRIKRYLKKYKVPLIWIGNLTTKEVMKKSNEINVIGIFSKPFSSKAIVALVIKYFSGKTNSVFSMKKV